jgi:hypothetical protein
MRRANRWRCRWAIASQSTRVTWRPVTIVRVDDEHAYVGGKIAEGDRIVSLGAHLLREGEPVRLADNAGAPTASVQP